MKNLHKKLNRKSMLSTDTQNSPKIGMCCTHNTIFLGFFEAMTFVK